MRIADDIGRELCAALDRIERDGAELVLLDPVPPTTVERHALALVLGGRGAFVDDPPRSGAKRKSHR